MKNKFEQNLPESYVKFSLKFKANIDRLNKTKETIFESTIDSTKITDSLILEHYNYFVRNYLDEYNSNGRDQAIILKSIYESYNQSIFNSVIDSIIESGTISYSNQILLENTEAKCNVSLDKVGKEILLESNLPLAKNITPEKEYEIIQENIFGLAAGATTGGALAAGALPALSGALGTAALPALGVGAIVSFAFSLLLPSRSMNNITQWLTKYFGVIGKALAGHTNYMGNRFLPTAQISKNMIINFDNIDADPTVINLFKKMQKTTASNPTAAEHDAKNGLATIVMQCVEQNKNIFDVADQDLKFSLFKNPKNYNLFKLFWKSTLGNANTDKNNHDILLRFRKCLSNKLVDVYKLLLISNLQNRRDHKKITDTISKINTGRPELILQFIPKENPEDEKLQEAILALVQFRIHLWELSKDFQSGMFDVDKEAGKYLQQKLSTVDAEVESYLRLNQHKWAPREENPNTRKMEFKKRSFLSNQSSL